MRKPPSETNQETVRNYRSSRGQITYTEHECEQLVLAIQEIHSHGVTIIWIEHIVHALLKAVEHLIVLNFGQLIAEGNPQSVMASQQVQEIYMGIEE